MTKYFPFFFLFSVQVCLAQVFIERAPVGAAATGEYNFYGTSTLSKTLPYERIKGSPFWNDDWQSASLYIGNRAVFTLPVRLNLATQEIHFLVNDREQVATAENGITAVVFHKGGDTSTRTAIFLKGVPHAYLRDRPLTGFLQVLNGGQYQLLKFTNRQVGSADSLFGTQKRYFFKDETNYFILNGEMVQPLKKLNDESFLSLLPSSSAEREWIKRERLSFKREEDMVKFLLHYNSRNTIEPK